MAEDEIIAALSLLTWAFRREQTFADKLRHQSDDERRAHVRQVGQVYRQMLRHAREEQPPADTRAAGRQNAVNGRPAHAER